MDNLWWNLPGPSQFVEKIIQDIKIGKNIIIGLPEYCVSGLYQAVRDSKDDEWMEWRRISVKQNPFADNPIELLCDYFDHKLETDEFVKVQSLFDISEFLGKAIWLEDIDTQHWETWVKFIQDYQHVCGSISELDRPLFCIAARGTNCLNLPKAEIRLSTHIFYNVVDSLDIQNYLYTQRNLEGESWLERKVATAVITMLAMWDKELIDQLYSKPLNSLLMPESIIEEFTIQRQWSDEKNKLLHKQLWQQGMINHFDGIARHHTCILIGESGKREIQRRIWRAQVSVLLPFIEEERLTIIDDLREYLQIPYITDHNITITAHLDLEIGHIFTQIRDNNKVDRPTRQRISLLRDMRNQLAHLEYITAEQLTDYKHFQKVPSTNYDFVLD